MTRHEFFLREIQLRHGPAKVVMLLRRLEPPDQLFHGHRAEVKQSFNGHSNLRVPLWERLEEFAHEPLLGVATTKYHELIRDPVDANVEVVHCLPIVEF